MYILGCGHTERGLLMYGFGGVGGLSRNPLTFFNQFFCYNISANCWEWPSASGIIPSPRAWHTTFICDNTAFLFGGLSNGPDGVEFLLNDLYTLDMVRMTWTQVHSSLRGDIACHIPGANVLQKTGLCFNHYHHML